MEKRVNKIWWIEDNKMVRYNGYACHSHSISKINSTQFRIILSCPELNDGVQFEILSTDLSEIIPMFD